MSNGLTYTGPINPDPKPDESSIIIYTYVPSLALGVVGVITFALIFAVNLYYAIKKRGKGYRSFHILILVGAVSSTSPLIRRDTPLQVGGLLIRPRLGDGSGWLWSADR